MRVREDIEWTQTRWNHAGDRITPRVLLIGDSITNGYGPEAAALLEGTANVDFLATSHAVDSHLLAADISNLLVEFRYRVIHFNNGLHGWHLDGRAYEDGYRRLLEMMLPHAPVMPALSTPVLAVGSTDRLDGEKDEILQERNGIVRRLAGEYGLKTDDLYAAMLGRAEYRLTDGYHYNEAGRKAQGRWVADALRPYLTALPPEGGEKLHET